MFPVSKIRKAISHPWDACTAAGDREGERMWWWEKGGKGRQRKIIQVKFCRCQRVKSGARHAQR